MPVSVGPPRGNRFQNDDTLMGWNLVALYLNGDLHVPLKSNTLLFPPEVCRARSRQILPVSVLGGRDT